MSTASNNKSNNNIGQVDDLYEYLHRLPKVELHAHLNGCIREETLFALAAERGVTLPDAYFRRQQQQQQQHEDDDRDGRRGRHLLYNTLPRSLSDCFAVFAEIPKAVDDLPALRRIAHEALDDFARDGVAYLELRSTPKRLRYDRNDNNNNSNGGGSSRNEDGGDDEKVATKREYIETILQVMTDFEAEEEKRHADEMARRAALTTAPIAATVDGKHSDNLHSSSNDTKVRLPMKCRLLVSVDRSQSVEEANEHVDLAIALQQSRDDARIVGMDLGGNPTKGDFSLFLAPFVRAREAGLRCTIHCGEIPCDDGPAYREAQAVLDFGPDRLGHALLLPADLQARVMDQKIPVESCPTSNVMCLELSRCRRDGSHLTLLQGLAQHGNLRQWLQVRHPLAISTDDPGVFETTLTKELWLVARTFENVVDEKDYLRRLATQPLDYAFCDDATKASIQARIKRI